LRGYTVQALGLCLEAARRRRHGARRFGCGRLLTVGLIWAAHLMIWAAQLGHCASDDVTGARSPGNPLDVIVVWAWFS
jgi:hypothetical protein